VRVLSIRIVLKLQKGREKVLSLLYAAVKQYINELPDFRLVTVTEPEYRGTLTEPEFADWRTDQMLRYQPA
jgi:hypothetical protein